MRQDWDTYFIGLALAASTRATCPKRQVGAVIVNKDNSVIATGYNGAPSGEPHCYDEGCLEIEGKCKRTIHAEDNAIMRTNVWSRRGSKMYVTDFPCYDCAWRIANAGIIEIVYGKSLGRNVDDVLALLKREGIVIRQHSPG